MTQHFRKKPVVIEALRWTGENADAIGHFCGFASQIRGREAALYITTAEGSMRANLGDWIIRGVAGEFYPCKPDIFDATYEAVEPWDE